MPEEKYYTVPEAAERLRVTRQALYKWMGQGRLGYVMVGSDRRITESHIRAFIKAGGDVGPSGEDGQNDHATIEDRESPISAAA